MGPLAYTIPTAPAASSLECTTNSSIAAGMDIILAPLGGVRVRGEGAGASFFGTGHKKK